MTNEDFEVGEDVLYKAPGLPYGRWTVTGKFAKTFLLLKPAPGYGVTVRTSLTVEAAHVEKLPELPTDGETDKQPKFKKRTLL